MKHTLIRLIYLIQTAILAVACSNIAAPTASPQIELESFQIIEIDEFEYDNLIRTGQLIDTNKQAKLEKLIKQNELSDVDKQAQLKKIRVLVELVNNFDPDTMHPNDKAYWENVIKEGQLTNPDKWDQLVTLINQGQQTDADQQTLEELIKLSLLESLIKQTQLTDSDQQVQLDNLIKQGQLMDPDKQDQVIKLIQQGQLDKLAKQDQLQNLIKKADVVFVVNEQYPHSLSNLVSGTAIVPLLAYTDPDQEVLVLLENIAVVEPFNCTDEGRQKLDKILLSYCRDYLNFFKKDFVENIESEESVAWIYQTSGFQNSDFLNDTDAVRDFYGHTRGRGTEFARQVAEECQANEKNNLPYVLETATTPPVCSDWNKMVTEFEKFQQAEYDSMIERVRIGSEQGNTVFVELTRHQHLPVVDWLFDRGKEDLTGINVLIIKAP